MIKKLLQIVGLKRKPKLSPEQEAAVRAFKEQVHAKMTGKPVLFQKASDQPQQREKVSAQNGKGNRHPHHPKNGQGKPRPHGRAAGDQPQRRPHQERPTSPANDNGDFSAEDSERIRQAMAGQSEAAPMESFEAPAQARGRGPRRGRGRGGNGQENPREQGHAESQPTRNEEFPIPESTEQSNTDEAIIFAPQKLMVDPDAKPRIPFSELGLSEKILATLTARGFTHATEVQAESIPAAMEKKNILCSSMTGSGKTLAFLIPMFERFMKNEIHQSLILSPTREIAMQTYKNLEPLLEPLGLRAGLVIGGTDMLMQKNSLRDYPQILVATPGRLVDMLKSGLVWLNYTDYVVLDEADRMLDMGFEEELMDIHKDLPGTQQTLLYTATLMPEVLKVAEKYAKDYHRISIGKELSAAETVTHSVIVLHASEKYAALRRILKLHGGKTIVFFNTIKETIQVSEDLKREGFNEVVAIHSGKNQDQRNRAISDLREGKKRALLGTDVAARGIDIPLVELVINYDLPNNPEEYIHRIGRTGRAGYTGRAISFCAKRDEVYLDAIEKILKHAIDRETRLQFRLAESSAPQPRMHGRAASNASDQPRRRHH